MKKLLIIFVAITLLAVLTGCESKDGNGGTTPSPSPSPSESATPTPEESPEESPTATPEVLTELEGSAKEVLESILVVAEEKLRGGDGLPMSFSEEVKPENSTGIGMTTEEYSEKVEEGYISMAMISVSAHEVTILKCKDEDTASDVKKLIGDGFDPGKWVCVTPGKCVVVNAAEYVLLVVSANKTCDAILEAFEELAGDKMGGVNEFFINA